MRPQISDQVALVTGAGRGIGRAIALRLTEEGCRVAALARTQRELDQTVQAGLAFVEQPMLAVRADVTNDGELESAVRLVIERLGPIGILINNAGFGPPRTRLSKSSLADWDQTLNTCLRAPMVLTRLVLPGMLARKQGAIVNIVSASAMRGRPREAAYMAAKSGLLGFTRSVYEEVHDRGIKIVAICPGLVDTDLIPPNKHFDRAKFLQPADIAEVVYHAVSSPIRMCPVSIELQPQFDPEMK